MTYTFANMETAMFMAIGASDALNTLPSPDYILLDDIGGRVGLNELIPLAKYADDVLFELSPNGDCPGVWVYEIAEEFGKWWIDQRVPSYDECKAHLLKTIGEWLQ